MSSLNKKLFCALIMGMIATSGSAYADLAPYYRYRTMVDYDAGYYLAIGLVTAIVLGVSIFILRRIYKRNQVKTNQLKEVTAGVNSGINQLKEEEIIKQNPEEAQLVSASWGEISESKKTEDEKI